MGDIMDVEESNSIYKDLNSHLIDPRALAEFNNDESIPSIFSCFHRSGVVEADSKGLSDTAQNVGEKRCFESELKETKHTIFLSHSGKQKNFVEQLCVDLENLGYLFPFFDQRSHSLPKGQSFAPLILEAAKRCHVAVIVLSETFLTSKWPMIELEAFYDAQNGKDGKEAENPKLVLMPLFYKLSRRDLGNEANVSQWMSKWKEYEKADPTRVKAEKWKKVIRALLGKNGFKFEQAHQVSTGLIFRSKVAYRKAIQKEILWTSPPNFLFGSQKEVVGFGRLGEVLASQFVKDSRRDLLLLGLYGFPGLGKTTMLETLCDHFCELGMMVCYLDLSDSSKDVLQRQKVVLKKLCEFGHDALQDLHNKKQGWNSMKEYFRRYKQCRIPVLLALDNIDGSFDEAQAYLDAGFCYPSKIVVTARSEVTVKKLLSNGEACQPVPKLTKEEAETIFLRNRIPLRNSSTLITNDQKQDLDLCLEKCCLRLADGEKQYHPSALKMLSYDLAKRFGEDLDTGYRLVSDHIEELDRAFRSALFKTMESRFKSVDSVEQLIFLDVAVFGVGLVTSAWNPGQILIPSLENWIDWLAGLHELQRQDVRTTLEKLEESGMLELHRDLKRVTMHELSRCFAVWIVDQENSSRPNWLRGRRRRMEGSQWKSIPRDELKQWKSLTLLQLISCSILTELDLQNLDGLRHLELQDLQNLGSLVLPSKNDSLGVLWLSGLNSLQELDISHCWANFQVVVITSCSILRRLQGFGRGTRKPSMFFSDNPAFYPISRFQGSTAVGKSLGDLYLKVSPKTYDEGSLEILSHICNLLRRFSLDGVPAHRIPAMQQAMDARWITWLDSERAAHQHTGEKFFGPGSPNTVLVQFRPPEADSRWWCGYRQGFGSPERLQHSQEREKGIQALLQLGWLHSFRVPREIAEEKTSRTEMTDGHKAAGSIVGSLKILAVAVFLRWWLQV